MGLLTVKLCQLLALRPDILPTEKCVQLQKLYQDGVHLPPEDTQNLLEKVSPKGFQENFTSLDMHPIASASIGQVHAGQLKNGYKVVIKIIKTDYLKTFQRDLRRMRRWIKIGLLLYPPLRRVGNPMGLLDHIEDYTMRELDLRNEIKGCAFLEKSLKILNDSGFVISKLNFPKMYPELSNTNVLVMERIHAPTIQTHLE
ncbi:AarF/UbiB family protein, partial [bacterium]|nr:AarF/UbiB family protein [bacterium]